MSRKRGDVRLGLYEGSRRRSEGVARRRRHSIQRDGAILTPLSAHESRHHGVTIVRHFRLNLRRGGITSATTSTCTPHRGDVDANGGQPVNVFPMTLQIVVVVEDFLTHFARIFPNGIFRLRTAVDADAMTPQIEAILREERMHYLSYWVQKGRTKIAAFSINYLKHT